MIVQNATLAMTLVCGFSFGAKAEDINTYETLQISCNPFSATNADNQCSRNLKVESETSLIAQTRRGRGRRRKSKVQNYYAGFSIGAGFVGGEYPVGNSQGTEFPFPEYSNGFVGSLFGGLNFTKNLAAELELYLGLGDLDTDELDDFSNDPANNIDVSNFRSEGDYSAFAIYINPRFELPLNEERKFSLYVSPGIGISQTNANYTAEDDLGFFDDTDASSTSFTYQIKGGGSIFLSETIGVFGQLRYASLPTDEDIDTINIFSTEAGMKFNF